MKKSEQLKIEAQQEDNDLKALGIYNKVIREERAERFEKYLDKLIEKGYDTVELPDQGKFTIYTEHFGIIDYYPKANKVLVRKLHKYIPKGLNWIINNLLK